MNADPYGTKQSLPNSPSLWKFYVSLGLLTFFPADTIIVPAGLPDMHKFSKQENRHFFLNGTPDSALDGVQFGLGGGLHDTPTGLSCYVHYPKARRRWRCFTEPTQLTVPSLRRPLAFRPITHRGALCALAPRRARWYGVDLQNSLLPHFPKMLTFFF